VPIVDDELYTVYAWIRSTAFLQVNRGVAAGMHWHAALQVNFVLQGETEVVVPGMEPLVGTGFVVDTNVKHAVDAPPEWQASIWLEPESAVAKSIAERFLAGRPAATFSTELLADVMPRYHAACRGELSVADASQLWDETEEILAPGASRVERLHPHIRRAIKAIDASTDYKLSAAELSGTLGISESHLMHLFKDELGVPLRRFLIWRRTVSAMRLLRAGASITDAAHGAGFHDGPHLTRVFKALFDVPPAIVRHPGLQFEFLDELEALAA
jgi:AraC-like DNA-binding protein